MKKLLIAALTSVALVGAAQAAVITTATQTINFGGTTDFNQSGTFQLFDSTLGTLLSINVLDSYGFTSTVTISNQAQSTSSGYSRTESTFTVAAANANQAAVLSSLLGSLDLLGAKVNYSLASGGSTSGASNVATSSSGFVTDTTASQIAYFAAAGGGLGTINGSTFTSTVLSNTGGNTSSAQSTNGTGQFQIFYTYDNTPAVPEPATWAMMIGGFGLVGYGLRRKGTAIAFN